MDSNINNLNNQIKINHNESIVNDENTQISVKLFELKNTCRWKLDNNYKSRKIKKLTISSILKDELIKIHDDIDLLKIENTFLWSNSLTFRFEEGFPMDDSIEIKFILNIQYHGSENENKFEFLKPLECFKSGSINSLLITLINEVPQIEYIFDQAIKLNPISIDIEEDEKDKIDSAEISIINEKDLDSSSNSFSSCFVVVEKSDLFANSQQNVEFDKIHFNIKEFFQKLHNTLTQFHSDVLFIQLRGSNRDNINILTIRDFYNKVIRNLHKLLSDEENSGYLERMRAYLENNKKNCLLLNKEIINYLLLLLRENSLKIIRIHLLENPITKLIEQFLMSLNELMKLKNNSLKIHEVVQIFSTLDNFTFYNNFNEFDLLKKAYGKNDFDKHLENFMNTTCPKILISTLPLNSPHTKKLSRIYMHLQKFAISAFRQINIIEEKHDLLTFDNSLDSVSKIEDNLRLKFSLICLKHNIDAIFFDSYKYKIKENFKIIIPNQNSNPDNQSEYEVIKEASLRISDLLSNLDEDDDLFNYLNFFNSPITDFHQKTFFNFTKENNFYQTKKVLLKQYFSAFILYDYEIIEKPINHFYDNETYLKDVKNEMESSLSFVENQLLNGVCCLNNSFMARSSSKETKKVKYCFGILHEIIHSIVFEKFLRCKNTNLKSPIIKELMKDKEKVYEESGEMFEYLLSEFYVDELLKDESEYKKEFTNALNQNVTFKKDLSLFIELVRDKDNNNKISDYKMSTSIKMSNNEKPVNANQQINLFDVNSFLQHNEHLDNNDDNSQHLENSISKDIIQNQSKTNMKSQFYTNSKNSIRDSSENSQSAYENNSQNFKKKIILNVEKQTTSDKSEKLNDSNQNDPSKNKEMYSLEFRRFCSNFEYFYGIYLEEFFPGRQKDRILAVFYVSELRLKRTYTRVELFDKIARNIKELLNQLKIEFPKWSKKIGNPSVILKINQILEKIYSECY